MSEARKLYRSLDENFFNGIAPSSSTVQVGSFRCPYEQVALLTLFILESSPKKKHQSCTCVLYFSISPCFPLLIITPVFISGWKVEIWSVIQNGDSITWTHSFQSALRIFSCYVSFYTVNKSYCEQVLLFNIRRVIFDIQAFRPNAFRGLKIAFSVYYPLEYAKVAFGNVLKIPQMC